MTWKRLARSTSRAVKRNCAISTTSGETLDSRIFKNKRCLPRVVDLRHHLIELPPRQCRIKKARPNQKLKTVQAGTENMSRSSLHREDTEKKARETFGGQ